MATVFRKHTRHRTGQRRAQNFRVTKNGEGICENCKKTRPPHAVCPYCGFYNGKLIVAKKVKKSKKQEGGAGEEKES